MQAPVLQTWGPTDRHTVRTLTLAQPWATLVAVGAKNIETRSWSTTYTGPLAIHAAKRIPADAQAACDLESFRQALCAAGYTCTPTARHNAWGLPLGQVVALVWLQSVQRIAPGSLPEEPERFFGDYTPGRFAWRFSALYRLPAPVQARGALGLWEWRPPELF